MNHRPLGNTGMTVSEIGFGGEHLEGKDAQLIDQVMAPPMPGHPEPPPPDSTVRAVGPEPAKAVACQSNLKQLMTAQMFYAADVGHYAGYNYNGAPPIDRVESYIGNGGMDVFRDQWTCPYGEPHNLPPYACPSEPQAICEVGGGTWMPYGWNTLLGGHVYSPGGPPSSPYFPWWRVDEILYPSGTLGWSECIGHGVVFPPRYT